MKKVLTILMAVPMIIMLFGCNEGYGTKLNERLIYNINFAYFDDLIRILEINTGSVGRIFFDGSDLNELGRTLYDFDDSIGDRMKNTARGYIAFLITRNVGDTITVVISENRIFILMVSSLLYQLSEDIVLLVPVYKNQFEERLLKNDDIHHIYGSARGTFVSDLGLHRFS